jgi:F-type H+-transporting ATPase subunit delta
MKADTFVVTYARTLLEFADEKGQLVEVREEVDVLIGIDSDGRLGLFLESPRIEKNEKMRVLEAALKGKTSDTLYKFILLTVRNGRSAGLREILEMFRVLYDEKIGLVTARVTTAVALSDELRSELKQALEKKLDKTVELSPLVDEEILGGMVVRFSGMVADSSLKTALDQMEDRMLSLKLGSELVHED